MPDPLAWQAQAACADPRDPVTDLFYPDGDKVGKAALAKQICRACPVQPDCLAYALANREKWGIWGGLPQSKLRRAGATPRKRPKEPSCP